MDRRSVKTQYFACCMKTDFSNAHHCGAVARHKTRLKQLFKFNCITVKNKVNETKVQAPQSNTSQFNEWHPVSLHVSIRKKSSMGNSLKNIWNISVI